MNGLPGTVDAARAGGDGGSSGGNGGDGTVGNPTGVPIDAC